MGREQLIKKVGFPNPLVSDSQKEKNEFGLSVFKAIESEWFRRENNECRFYTNRDKFHKLRLYARGEQSSQKYKDELAVNGDLSWMNLDWTPVPIIPKFVDIVVNGMSDRMYSVKAYSVDKLASDTRNKYIEEMKKDMVAKDFLNQANQELGINGFVNEEIPANDEELEVHMQLNYKQGIEIAQEEAINSILEKNDYADIKKRVDYDLTVLGIGACKHSFNLTEGIKLNYIDPADIVYSYTDSPYFDDCYYFGEVKRVTLGEIKKIRPDLSQDTLEMIKQSGTQWQEYHLTRRETSGEFDSHTVNLLYFTYKTTKDLNYKQKDNKNGGSKIIKKGKDFNPAPAEDYRKLTKTVDVWYEGVAVLGTNILLQWELAKNMVRPESSTHTCVSPYVVVAPRVYQDRIESLVQRMIPFADLIQLTHLKLQQVASKIVPDGIYVDADGLNEVDLGNGQMYNPTKAIELYFQTGSVIGRSYTAEGEYNHGKVPIQELTSGGGNNKIQALITLYNQYMDMIRAVTGLNEARDASTPNSEALVGVQKLAVLNSNTATRHVLMSGLYITRKTSEGISYRIADILKYSDMKKDFIKAIGKFNVSILNDIKKLHLHDFAIFIEIEPDQEEKSMLENNIQQSLAKEKIYLEDAIDIRGIKNLKLANQLLKIRRKKKAEEDFKQQDALNKSRSQADAQSAQVASQAKLQQIQAEAQAKMAVDNNLTDKEIKKMEAEVKFKERLMDREFRYNMALKGMEVDGQMRKQETAEDRKDKRQDRNNSQQSKMKAESKKENPKSFNFESEEDSLDGFDFAQFNPR